MNSVEPVGQDPAGRIHRSRFSDRPHDPRWSRQPALGLLGLLLVVPMAAALALAAGGGDGSTHVLGPLVAFSLPLVAMVAFWWKDWPGMRLRASWSGWADTALIAAGTIVLTGLGQTLAGHLDPTGMFDPSPGRGHVPTFPATLPLAGTAFVAMLQITLVGEGWPLRGLPRLPAGVLAVAASWAIALVVHYALVRIKPPPNSDVIARHGPIPADDLGTTLILIGAWQVVCYVVWRGWPFSTIATRPARMTYAHTSVLSAGVLTYVVAHVILHVDAARIAAVAGCSIAAGLLLGMLLEDWLSDLTPRAERIVLLLGTLALTVLLTITLRAAANALQLLGASGDEWVEHASLNAISTSIILHVAIGRRWPFPPRRRPDPYRALEEARQAR